MKKILRLLVVVLLLGGWSLAALALHVIVAPGSPGRVIFVPKNQLGIKETYVDTRHWTLGDVAQHPQIAQRLIQTGKTDALAHVANPGEDLVATLNDAIEKGTTVPPTTKPANVVHPQQARARK
jgi:hypothetical protein